MGTRRASSFSLQCLYWVLILLWNASKAEMNSDLEVIHSIPDSPRIDFEDEDMVLFSGATLHLRCESNKPVKWTTPKYKTVEGEYPDQLSFNITMNKNPVYKYESHLEIKDLDVMDTGYYYCHYEENDDLITLDDVASKYVYVNDSEHLLVTDESFIHLTPTQYKEVTIPCKPSSPDVNITLSKDSDYIFPAEDNNVRYDPKLGYLISPVNIDAGGFYMCFGKRGEHQQSMSISLKVLPHTNAVPKPSIDDNNARHVVVGGELHLLCTVQMELSVIFNLEWNTPNQIANETGRMEVSDAQFSKMEHSNFDYSIGSKNLTIHNVTYDDQGYYTCVVTDHTHKKNQIQKFIRVYDEPVKL